MVNDYENPVLLDSKHDKIHNSTNITLHIQVVRTHLLSCLPKQNGKGGSGRTPFVDAGRSENMGNIAVVQVIIMM